MHMHMHMHIHMHIPMHIVCVCDGGAGKDLAFSAEIVSHGAVKPLVVMLASAQTETRGYACIYSLHKTYRCTCAHMHRQRRAGTRPLAPGLDAAAGAWSGHTPVRRQGHALVPREGRHIHTHAHAAYAHAHTYVKVRGCLPLVSLCNRGRPADHP